jgi:general stress protein 26
VTDANERHRAIEVLSDLIMDIPVAMFTTCRADHTLTSRPMVNVNQRFDGDLWFFVRSDRQVLGEILGNPQINASFQSDDGKKFVSVSGTATHLQDLRRVELLWTDECKAWFDQGFQDPQLALIKVDVHRAEYWDSSKNAMVTIAGFLQHLVGRDSKHADVKHGSIDWESRQGQMG